jgi:hypothetical protein
MVTEETTKEFKEAIMEEYGKNISLQEASKILNDLVGYFDTLAKIDYDIQNRA